MIVIMIIIMIMILIVIIMTKLSIVSVAGSQWLLILKQWKKNLLCVESPYGVKKKKKNEYHV